MTSPSPDQRWPSRRRRLLFCWTLRIVQLSGSGLLHGFAYAALGSAPPAPTEPPRKSPLRFEVVGKPVPSVPVSPPPPPLTTPVRSPPPPLRAKPSLEPARVPDAPSSAAEPPETRGVTLAADAPGSSFAMPLDTVGALASPAPRAEPRLARLSSPQTRTSVPAPALVRLGDLSTRPSPPLLGAALEKNYPQDARRRGLSGSAKIRVRVDADGVVRAVRLLDESTPEFGAACARTLTGSRWSPPRDKAGRSVATEIRYTCRFVVQP